MKYNFKDTFNSLNPVLILIVIASTIWACKKESATISDKLNSPQNFSVQEAKHGIILTNQNFPLIKASKSLSLQTSYGLTNDQAYALAWGGLEGTPAFASEVGVGSAQAATYKAINDAYRDGSAASKPCSEGGVE